MAKSYSSLSVGLLHRFRELRELYFFHTRDIAAQVGELLGRMGRVEQAMAEALREPLTGTRMLEIGPGQKLIQMRYFATRAEVVGIDLDTIPMGFDLRAYWDTLRHNGAVRLAKTVARKLVGIDARFSREYACQLGVSKFPRAEVLRMDAAHTSFPDSSFDCVFSFSVFEHLQDPGAVMKEVARVLRPGGVAYISTHLYTSDTGCHDPRQYSRNRDALPYWSHLRPRHRDLVEPNTYLNEISLLAWETMFEQHWPGVRFDAERDDQKPLLAALEEIRSQGELSEYSDRELLTKYHIALWKKPLSA